MSCEQQLIAKLQARVDRAWAARELAQATGNKGLMRMHASHANEMAELIDAIKDGSATWVRKLPLTT